MVGSMIPDVSIASERPELVLGLERFLQKLDLVMSLGYIPS